MKKIAEISPCKAANMTIYYDKTAKVNPYRVYLEWMESTEHGLTHRKRQIHRFADLASGAYEMWQYALKYNEDGRD